MRVLWLGLEREVCAEDCEVLTINKGNYSLEIIRAFNPQIVFEREFNADGMSWEKEIQEIKTYLPGVTTATWLVDTHVRLDFHKSYAPNFDYCFLAISKYLPEIPHPHKFWLPLCYPANAMPYNQQKTHDLGFVGRFNVKYLEDRTAFLEEVRKLYPDFYTVTDYNSVYQTMSQIKIIINKSYKDDMNFRTFEALASGCELVTNDVPDLHKITGLMDRISVYTDLPSLKRIVDIKLREPLKNHQCWIRENHRLGNRLNSAIRMMQTGKQEAF